MCAPPRDFQATLPSLSNAPSLSPIRRKGKEKDAAEPSAAPLSPKKASEVNTGTHTQKERGDLLCKSVILPSHANVVCLVSRQASRRLGFDSHQQIHHTGQLLPSATLLEALRRPQSYTRQLQGKSAPHLLLLIHLKLSSSSGAVAYCVRASQVTLDLHSSQEKFGSFLRATLDVLSQLLELATLNDINKVSTRFLQSTCYDDFLLLICELFFCNCM